MSRQTCQHLGVKLADTSSCGARCAQFPSCLPPLPAGVLAAVADRCAAFEADLRSSVAVSEFLELMRQAVAEGMARRDGEESAGSG